MLLGGCLFCLLYFSQIQGYMALARDRLVGLSRRDRSLCHLVASDPSARSLSFLAQLRGFQDGAVLFQTRWNWQGHLEQCIIWEEKRMISAYLAFCLDKWEKPLPPPTFLRAWDSQLDMDLRHLEGWGVNCSNPLTSAAARGLWDPPVSPSRLLQGRRRSASPAPARGLYTPRRSRFLRDPIAAAAAQRKGVSRRRRGWTFPGTIWCGAGDSAENFSDLGLFDRTDLCCREHDHCEHKISAFEYNYGMWNYRLHTISHCDCDYSFRKCLLNVNDTISALVGITFFSILQVPCFSLELVEHCVKKTWWSRCNITELVPQAILHPQSKYNYTQPILDQFQTELGSKPMANPAATSRQNQMATGLSVGSTSVSLLPNSTQKIKRKNKKKCHKCNGHWRRKTKVPSQNTLKMRSDMISTMVISGMDFSPTIRQNLVENSFSVALEEKDVSRKLLQRNASNALDSQVNGSMAVGLDEHINKEHGLSFLGELSTATSLPESILSTLSSSQNVTLPLIRLDKNIRVDSSFPIPPRKKCNLSSLSKNRRSKSLLNHVDRKGLASVNPACGIGNWSRSGIIGSSSYVHQSPDPTRRHQTRDKGNSRICNCYRPLDRCEYKISPHEFKFSYYNPEPKTLYHCDCTKRFAKRMKKRVNVNTVKQLLSEFVSLSCFWLKSVLRNCSKEEQRLCEKQLHSTVAILSKPKYLQKILKVQRTVGESLYPLTEQQERNKNETSIGTNSVKLYKKCLQMIQALTLM
ncbi:group 3 secretory phospholipase A2 [Carcharodon carcharias]|uniref:group 3 secretory phospholipase A2 n=1 Tax=Carcharodon carcharias TaxID=13397 RepID=UPI001B7E670E|nr:group 3 secretory phospholipase A2 [Carcharodon carcharias]